MKVILHLNIGVNLSSLRKEGYIYTEKINQQYRFKIIDRGTQ